MKSILVLSLVGWLTLSAVSPAAGEEVTPIDPLVLLGPSPHLNGKGHPTGWEFLVFRKIRPTTYHWSVSTGSIHAVSDSSAAGLIYRFRGDLAERPILRWRWKINQTLPDGNAYEKSGDDFAARIHVTFEYNDRRTGWMARLKNKIAEKFYGQRLPHAGINYVWANRLPEGESINSPYTRRVQMVAVRSGDYQRGQWLSEERNLLEDFRKLFGGTLPALSGIAIMTDTDNTEGKAEAWYADITLSPSSD